MSEKPLITRILDVVYRGFQFLAWTLMGLLIVPVTLQILSRYTGLIPRYIWTEEAARFCFIWIIMVGATIAVRDGTHFEVDVLPTPKTPKLEAIMRLWVYVAMLIFTGIFVLYGYQYAMFGWIQTSELTGINMIFIHGVYFVVGVTWTLFLGERVWWAIRVLRGDHAALGYLRGDYNVAR
ncbi:MAG: TRAP transporter small permease [Candidatus Methylomirabilales bacterium]